MAEPTKTKLTLRDRGPLLVEGPFELCDAEGNRFPLDPSKPIYAICRCGQSKNGPFCDGTHSQCGFAAAERAPQ